MTTQAIDRWLPFRKPRTEPPRLRVFCLPNAGGAASMFRRWTTGTLPPTVEVCPVQLPGRENRMREQPMRRCEPLVDALIDVVRPLLDRPYLLFGHSMGTIVGYEMTHRLRAAGAPLPLRLLMAGRRAPHLPREDKPPVHELTDPELIERLRDYGGTPDEILDNQELMGLVLPTIRADFDVVDAYQPPERPPLPMPIDVFGGHDDEDAPREKMEAWSVHTAAACRVRMLPGGHFFLHEHRAPMDAALREVVDDVLAGLPTGPAGS